ncbi:MAG: hypothetical protein RMM53_03490, partial [Bacteroidia bacterium]|nr:hypothetical protein [Bacteroidia bacterium]
VETQADFFAQFHPEPPALIIDPDGVWTQMRKKLPPVLENYREYAVGKYTLYIRGDIPVECKEERLQNGKNAP